MKDKEEEAKRIKESRGVGRSPSFWVGFSYEFKANRAKGGEIVA